MDSGTRVDVHHLEIDCECERLCGGVEAVNLKAMFNAMGRGSHAHWQPPGLRLRDIVLMARHTEYERLRC